MDSPSRFEPTEGAAVEKIGSWTLNPSPPSNILPSNVLCPCFEQRTSDDCFCLILQRLGPSSALNLSSPSLPLSDLVSSVGSQPPSFLLSSTLPPPATDDGLSTTSRANLLAVVRDLSTEEKLSGELIKRFSHEYICLAEPEVGVKDGSNPTFETKVASRLCRLKQSRPLIWKDWGARRLWLVLIILEIDHISQSEDIKVYTSRGVNQMSAAMKMAKKYLGTVYGDCKRGRNIVEVMEKGGPASLFVGRQTSSSTWETKMNIGDIDRVFQYRRTNLPHLDRIAMSYNQVASDAIAAYFVDYGWSISELQNSDTKVAKILKPYLTHKKQHTDGWLGPELGSKRRHNDESGVSASYNYLASSSDELSGSNQIPLQLSDSPAQIAKSRAPDAENFRLLGQHSPLAARLLALLCMFDVTNIPEICFCRFRVPRECWGADGEIEPVVHHTTDQLFDLLSVESWFNSTIECLESTGLIESRSGPLDKRMFVIKHTVQEYVKQAVPDHEHLEWLCLVVVCHAFPGRNEDIAFGDSVRSLLPQVQHAFSHCQRLVDRIVSHPTVGYGIVLTLLLSSYASSREWKVHALNLTGSILSHNPQFGNRTMYLEALKRQREREISRRLRNMSIQSLCEEPRPIDPRTNTLYGQHLRSNAQDLIMKDCNLGTALSETFKFKFYTTPPSSMEKVERYHMDFMQGKIYRWLAKFSMAHKILKLTILSPCFQSDGTGCSVISHFVGVLCELRCLEEAESTARQYIRHLESLDDQVGSRRDLMSFRSLRLLLAETLVCRTMVKRADGAPCTDEDFQRLVEAEGIFNLLKTEYELNKMEKGASWASEMKYLQVCIGRALTSHLRYRFDEAYKRWEAAREPVHLCKDVVTGFFSMIIDYSLCDISQKWGKREDAARLLNRASTCFATIGREHWWTGLGTFLLDIYMGSIQNSGISSMG